MKRITLTTSVLLLLLLYAPAYWGPRDSSAKGEGRPHAAGPQNRHVPGRLLVRFRPGVASEHADAALRGVNGRAVRELPGIDVGVVELPAEADEATVARALSLLPEVEFAELDRILPAEQLIPNDPWYGDPNSWSLVKINGPDAWAISTGSSSVIIAILDTGVYGMHEDLAAKMVPGWNVYDNNADTNDVYGHGTAVAGTAAASSNNGVGVASVAWGCSIMPVRISAADGTATISAVADGLSWAANHGARVANVSYKATGSSTITRAAKYFQSKGGVVTVAAGNDGGFTSLQDDPYILTVGATDSWDNMYSWSCYGNNQDLVAPGNVETTTVWGGYGIKGGTSFAAPIVAGAAALVLSVNPNLTPGQVQDTLKQSADDLGAPGWDPSYGAGRVNLARALNMTPVGDGGADFVPPSVTITSPSDGASASGAVSVLVNATDNVGVVKVELYVDGVLYNTSTSAPFTIRWNSRKTTGGAHTLESRAYDPAGNTGTSSPVKVYK